MTRRAFWFLVPGALSFLFSALHASAVTAVRWAASGLSAFETMALAALLPPYNPDPVPPEPTHFRRGNGTARDAIATS